MLNRNLLASVALFFAAGALWAGCTVGFEPENAESGLFTCSSGDDCLDGYECDNGRCEKIIDDDIAPPCDSSAEGIDQDGDGFGTGDDRRDCRNRCEETGGDNCVLKGMEVDCDDTNADVYPGAPEFCDGVPNNCLLEAADEAGIFSCSSVDDCPEQPADEGGTGVAPLFGNVQCESSQCVYLPFNQNPCTVDNTVIRLTCTNSTNYTWVRDSSKGLADLPEGCPN